MNQEDINQIEMFQKLGLGLRRTGAVLIVCGLVGFAGVILDFPGDVAVASGALGLVFASGINMLKGANDILNSIDTGLIEILRSKVIR